MRLLRWIFGLLTTAVLLSACSGKGGEDNQPASTAKIAAAGDTAVSVEPLDEAGVKRLIRNREGKVLLVNVWATWCVPCVEEFPDIVKLSHSYDAKTLEVVAVSADYPDEVDSKIIPFLKKQKVPFKVYVAKFDDQQDFINALDPEWSGALPATLIYDQHGRQRFFHVGQQTYEQFKDAVDKVKGSP
jgi:thiol-disulfide isomerase/thioredoxin